MAWPPGPWPVSQGLGLGVSWAAGSTRAMAASTQWFGSLIVQLPINASKPRKRSPGPAGPPDYRHYGLPGLYRARRKLAFGRKRQLSLALSSV